MPLINCLTCGYHQSERVPAKLVGKKIKCPQCRRAVAVQADQTMEPIDFPMGDDAPTSVPKAKATPAQLPTRPNVYRPATIPPVPPILIVRERKSANSRNIMRAVFYLLIPAVLVIAAVVSVRQMFPVTSKDENCP